MESKQIGPVASIYRAVYTNSRIGFRVERWNRFAGKWQLAGYERALRIAEDSARWGIVTLRYGTAP